MTTPSLKCADPSTPKAVGRGVERVRLFACWMLAAVAAVTCLRIELLNDRAGGILPRRSDAGKWRARSIVNFDATWREMRSFDVGDPSLLTRPLAEGERAEYQADVDRAIANRDLRDVVGSWGIAQYLVVLGGLESATTVARSGRYRRRWRRVAVGCAIVLAAAGAMAVYRGYFTATAA